MNSNKSHFYDPKRNLSFMNKKLILPVFTKKVIKFEGKQLYEIYYLNRCSDILIT